jgi:hypothetical protein
LHYHLHLFKDLPNWYERAEGVAMMPNSKPKPSERNKFIFGELNGCYPTLLSRNMGFVNLIAGVKSALPYEIALNMTLVA